MIMLINYLIQDLEQYQIKKKEYFMKTLTLENYKTLLIIDKKN